MYKCVVSIKMCMSYQCNIKLKKEKRIFRAKFSVGCKKDHEITFDTTKRIPTSSFVIKLHNKIPSVYVVWCIHTFRLCRCCWWVFFSIPPLKTFECTWYLFNWVPLYWESNAMNNVTVHIRQLSTNTNRQHVWIQDTIQDSEHFYYLNNYLHTTV